MFLRKHLPHASRAIARQSFALEACGRCFLRNIMTKEWQRLKKPSE